MAKVWVVVADYRLNGAGVLGVFDRQPTDAEVHALESDDGGRGYGAPWHTTGYGGAEVEEWEVRG